VDLLPRHHPAARELTRTLYEESFLPFKKETDMSNQHAEHDLREELRTTAVEPLLPIEKKLIAWSLGIGLLLLIVLAAVNHVYSAGP
jgi:hypothetical protein